MPDRFDPLAALKNDPPKHRQPRTSTFDHPKVTGWIKVWVNADPNMSRVWMAEQINKAIKLDELQVRTVTASGMRQWFAPGRPGHELLKTRSGGR